MIDTIAIFVIGFIAGILALLISMEIRYEIEERRREKEKYRATLDQLLECEAQLARLVKRIDYTIMEDDNDCK